MSFLKTGFACSTSLSRRLALTAGKRRVPRWLTTAVGFTVIELLIVVSVCAILIAILLPVISASSRLWRLATCTSHLRQLATAYHLYLQDHNGQFADVRPDNQSTDAAPGIRDYLRVPSGIFKDTAYTCPGIQATENRSSRPYHLNIGVNSRFSVDRFSHSINNVRRITEPERTLMFTETPVNPTQGPARSGGKNFYTHWGYLEKERLPYPHQDRQNVVFLDGHIEQLTIEQIGTGRGTYPWSGGVE